MFVSSRAKWLCVVALCGGFGLLSVPAFGAVSHAEFWQALGDNVYCGVAIPTAGKAPTRLLCSAHSVPAPKTAVGYGDPGFVFLSAHGRPLLARLSQNSFAASTARPARLPAGSRWTALGVSCTISATTVRCANGSAHGFAIGKKSYRAF
jgi:hypothetical protein